MFDIAYLLVILPGAGILTAISHRMLFRSADNISGSLSGGFRLQSVPSADAIACGFISTVAIVSAAGLAPVASGRLGSISRGHVH
ncbi:hypothetical protein [Sedimentitalea nanhaiensis]|uniref:hypothetical protein n=1 Tax=Sedimentitalea nanhaiensis TaxID=999627 RepID=UPI00111449E6|nr:hypothetical protein [Sedimentitalea nanhaiensis]